MTRPDLKLASATYGPDLIDQFSALTESVNSPSLFRKWGAIAMVAGALERKLWVRTKGSNLYPNVYITLVAPPGVGKTEITAKIRDKWQELEEHHVAANSLTKAALIDELNEATRRVIRPNEDPGVIAFNSLLVASNELGVLIPQYENDFMNALTDIYDGKGYNEKRRTKDLNIKIAQPNLTLLAACTPAYLRETIPAGAWDQGFLSRVILVYSGEDERTSLFEEEEEDAEAWEAFNLRLEDISKLYGKCTFDDEAKQFLDAFYRSGGGDTKPDHPKLSHYNTRRTAHLLKLSMIATAARYPEGPRFLITIGDVHKAIAWMLEAELYMPDIFKSMAAGGDSEVIQETYHFVYNAYVKDRNTPVSEGRVVMFLQSRTAAHNIVRILEIMEKGMMLKKEHIKKRGWCYTPAKPEY